MKKKIIFDRSIHRDFMQVLNRAMEPRPLPIPSLPFNPMVQTAFVPQFIITSGTRKDCVRLRGLPYEAQVEHILEFLGDHSKNIVFQGVHLVFKAPVRKTSIK